MKIALVHDDFCQAGGAEGLFATLAAMYPKAPIYTSLVNWSKLPQSIERSRVRTSFMQKIPFAAKFFKLFLPFYPLAFESFNFDKYDVVVSSTTRFANSIITKPKTVHIAYVNSVPRFLWDENAKKHYLNPVLDFILKPMFSWLKRWDIASSARADYYVANSKNVQEKIKNVYERPSEVVYPYANTDFFKAAKVHKWGLKSKEYFLVVTRLVKWKKVDIAIDAANEAKINLIVVGNGPDKKRLQSKAGAQNVTFVGKVTLEELRAYYQNCQALIVTQEEDFGIAAVEAQACGRPVLAYKNGGAAEIVVNGKTGLFFEKQTAESLKDGIERFGKVKWESAAIRKNSGRFSKAVFEKEITKVIASYGRS